MNQQWLNQKIAQSQGLENPNTRLAQYGTTMVQADDLAKVRGSGLFNPVPIKEQTTDRGRAYQEALEVYSRSAAFQASNIGNFEYEKYDKNDNRFAEVENSGISGIPDSQYRSLDRQNKMDYVVGTSSLHPESSGSWKNPDFMNSRGDNQYIVWACQSMNMQPSALLNFLFSTENVEYIQKQIVKEVYRIRKIQIAKQSTDELLIIMRNKYLYALTGWLPRNINEPSKVYPRGTLQNPNGLAYDPSASGCGSLEYQLTEINNAILEECVKQVLSGIDEYNLYYKDASSLPMPLSRSVYTSNKGSNVLQPNIGFQSGHEASREISSYNQRFSII